MCKDRNVALTSIYRDILLKDRNYAQIWKFAEKIEILRKARNFAYNIDICAKLEILRLISIFAQRSKLYDCNFRYKGKVRSKNRNYFFLSFETFYIHYRSCITIPDQTTFYHFVRNAHSNTEVYIGNIDDKLFIAWRGTQLTMEDGVDMGDVKQDLKCLPGTDSHFCGQTEI